MFIKKFFHSNLKNKISILLYSVILCSCVITALLMGNAFSIIAQQTANYSNGYCPTIIIDAGHGGEDGGAQGATGVLEKDVNLSIAKTLKQMFISSGFKVEMTRDDDISIYDSTAETLRQKKVSDLRNRLKIINSNENGVLISVHQNKFTDSKYSGAQVFYAQKNQLSRELAEQMKRSITGLLQPDNTREIKPCNKNIFLLWESNIPSVVVECGFLSNLEEEAKLKDPNYQRQIAFAIYCGFLQFWKNI